jgi:hypothetical protein
MRTTWERCLGNSIQNLIRLLLVLTAGGLAPLSYLDAYSPHQGFQGYHFSLFQTTKPIRPLPDDAPAALKARWPVKAITSDKPVGVHLLPNLPDAGRLSWEGWGHGYPLPSTKILLFNAATCFAFLITMAFFGKSAWLAPPDVPPRLFRSL